MRSISRTLRLMFAAAAGLAMSVALSASPASASTTAAATADAQSEVPAAAATWDLSDGGQRLCIPANRNYSSYFVGAIAGSWDTPLATEVQGFPEGTVVEMPSSIPPGDNGDKYLGTIWISVDLPPLDYGEYEATLVVTDGTVTQTDPLVVRAQEEWGC